MKPQNYLTKSDLQTRGWKKKSIKYFLDPPDKLKKNASKSIPTQLFSLSRVLKCEEQIDFKNFNQNKTKQDSDLTLYESSDSMNYPNIDLPSIEKRELYQKACKHWQKINELRYLDRNRHNIVIEVPNYKTCDKTFLNRITVQFVKQLFLNHLLSFYQKENINKHLVDTDIHIYSQISDVYPYLSKECEFQIVKIQSQY